MSKVKANDAFMLEMRDKGYDTVFASELPHPTNLRGSALVLAKQGNLIYIREGVAA